MYLRVSGRLGAYGECSTFPPTPSETTINENSRPKPIENTKEHLQCLKQIELNMLTFANLCYLKHGGKVLLQRKARNRFGGGKWNAPGGKARAGESPERAITREMFEETGLRVRGLQFHGILNFYLGEEKELDQTVFVFSCQQYSGKLRHSQEGILKWFRIDEIPYGEMWEDDKVWLPLLLEGKSFVGDFHFTESYGRLINSKIYEESKV